MGKVVSIVLFFALSIFVLAGAPPAAAQRYARCDACGFCDYPNQIQPQALEGLGTELADKQPSDVADCHRCLYPGFTPESIVAERLSLLINEELTDTETGPIPPTPAAGKYYTMFGCIDTQLGSFTQTGSSGAVVQQLLNVIFATVGGIAFLAILFGAYIILTSRADPNRLNYGRRIIVGAVVGLVFTLSAVFIINMIGGNILGIPSV